MNNPPNISPVEWSQALGLARQTCARVFRDGGSPADAVKIHGLDGAGIGPSQWDRAIQRIAAALSGAPSTGQAPSKGSLYKPRMRAAQARASAPAGFHRTGFTLH